MRWANSAFGHGISERRCRYVIEHAYDVFDVPAANDPTTDRVLYVGDDPDGVPLEVIVAESETDEGEPEDVVIHAMKLRAAYRGLYERAVRARYGGRGQ